MFKRILALLLTLIALPVMAVELGDDGLHKTEWLNVTFKDMTEDLETAHAQGKHLAILVEQRGCIYCTKMHNDVFPDPKIAAHIKENYYFVQMNMFGDEEVTDFDGTVLPEKEMIKRWGLFFTPTIMFMPDTMPEAGNAAQAAVAIMPGAFGKETTFDMLEWVHIKGYETDEHFQKYHARKFLARKAASE